MFWHVYFTCSVSFRDSFFLLLKYTFSALKRYGNCGNFSYYWATSCLGESGRAQCVWINAELEAQGLPTAPRLTAGRLKGLAAGLALRQVTIKKGKWGHPRHFQWSSSCLSDQTECHQEPLSSGADPYLIFQLGKGAQGNGWILCHHLAIAATKKYEHPLLLHVLLCKSFSCSQSGRESWLHEKQLVCT